jgi:o-succinylbenzoate synthase
VRIERAELRLIPLRLRERFEISSGARQDRVILLVTLQGDGRIGWGECVAAEDPSYSYETTETAWHILTEFLLPDVIGKTFESPADLLEPVAWVRGHRMAKAALEMAAWDLYARLLDEPLATAIGSTPRPVPVGVSVGLQPSDDALLEKVEEYVEQGYRRIKIKIKPGRDVEMLTKVRERFPDVPLVADANAAYTLADAEHLRRLDPLGLLMIEQPLGFEDLRDHARLQQELATAICLDESIESVDDARFALELGACRIVNIKPGRVGGFQGAKAIHDLCAQAGVPVWCGGMLESGIGRAHNVSLATFPNFTLPGDISESRRYWEKDIVSPEFVMHDGTLSLPTGAGIAVEPDLDMIESLVVRRAVVPQGL